MRSKLTIKECKPCGREPEVQRPWRVYCDECGRCAVGKTEDEAIKAWNRLMRKLKSVIRVEVEL